MSSLYIVATPIGNLGDITFRALETLKGVDVIVAEDTRHTRKLLAHFDIHKPLESCDEHAGEGKMKKIIDALNAGKNIAFVTDAGTPAVSDPGSRLVARVVAAGHTIITVPGPSAVTAALSVSGFPADNFTFLGFLPHKKGRQEFLQRVAGAQGTVVFFESTHRIARLLDELEKNLPSNRQLIIARELTKQFETIYRGTIAKIREELKEMRGEFTVVVAPL
ncbi:MAG: 16S rRNA (cytidine(1402)-2'-O)-methyltransferase [Patescibacteria group bacterium]